MKANSRQIFPTAAIVGLDQIREFHPSFRPHFLNSLEHDLWPGRINVFANFTSNFVIAAPHGYRKDDRNTEILAHALALRLKANAVINHHKYRKPKGDNDPRAAELSVKDPTNPLPDELAVRERFSRKMAAVPVDLNKWPDAMVAAPDFFQPLATISQTLCRNSTPMVLFIHGIADQNVAGERNPDFVVAAGYECSQKAQAFESGLTTAGEIVVDRLVAGLTGIENKGREVWVAEGLPGYSAANRIRMPWMFKNLPGDIKKPLSVHAIQLEVRHKGFREVENIPTTARKLAAILLELEDCLTAIRTIEPM